jgi:carboxyl-terminal processing protease
MLFSDVFNHIRTNYIDEVKTNLLVKSAIEGMLASLDPHSTYLDALELGIFNSMTEGKGYETGIEIMIVQDIPFVISIDKEGPAAKTLLTPGDIILKIDEFNVLDYSEPEIRLMLAGEKDSQVKLTVRNPITNEEEIVTIKREEMPLKTISLSAMIEREIGYIRISKFSTTTADEYKSAVDKLRRDGMKHLILDLRGNPGGLMKSALDILDMYAPEGEMIARIGARKEIINDTIYASDIRKQPMYSIDILINRSTASAAELLAGTLQDLDRALIVGNNSLGKGLVQKIFNLSDGSAILMTIGKYYTASGRCLQHAYKGKKRQDYYYEIFESESLYVSDQQKYTTKKGRTIYGGGGVFPDVVVKSPQLDLLRHIDRSGTAIRWATSVYEQATHGYKKFEDFKSDFIPSDSMMNDYIDKFGRVQIDSNLLKENVEILRILLKSEIAFLKWGAKESLLISKDIDPIIREAVANIPSADELIEKQKN